ncbi:MAG: hypothetical protein ABI782_03835 [Anaerolineaceae bacterium]
MIALAAALPGVAVFAQTPPVPNNCLSVRLEALSEAVLGSDLVVIGVVREENGGGLVRIEPQAYLKGAASNDAIRLVPRSDQNSSSCELARLVEGTRLMAFLQSSNGQMVWPGAAQVFSLSEGRASGSGGNLTESELVEKVRSITHQYAVPAASESEGAGIDWRQTVLPLSVALVIVFGLGLVLMRVWHRIDPT